MTKKKKKIPTAAKASAGNINSIGGNAVQGIERLRSALARAVDANNADDMKAGALWVKRTVDQAHQLAGEVSRAASRISVDATFTPDEDAELEGGGEIDDLGMAADSAILRLHQGMIGALERGEVRKAQAA